MHESKSLTAARPPPEALLDCMITYIQMVSIPFFGSDGTDYAVAAMFAVGRPGNPDDLPPEVRAHETPSPRKPVREIICEGKFAG
jgi:hypothetical protein